jgi:hypothetical protein
MNKYGKAILFSVCLSFFSLYGFSQDTVSAVKKPRIQPFYSIEANFGATARIEANGNDADFLYKALTYGGNFMGGVELTHYFKVGLGVGYLYYKQEDHFDPTVIYGLAYYWNPPSYNNFDQIATYFYIQSISTATHAVPLFLFIRSNFLNKKVSPYLDLKIGNNFFFNKGTAEIIEEYYMIMDQDYKISLEFSNGLYLASNIGVSIKTNSSVTINASIGYQYISRYINFIYPTLSPTKDKFTKTEWAVIDHQFMINLGISF